MLTDLIIKNLFLASRGKNVKSQEKIGVFPKMSFLLTLSYLKKSIMCCIIADNVMKDDLNDCSNN